MVARKKTENLTTDPKKVLDFETVAQEGGTPQAPSVDEPTPGEEQETEQHENLAEQEALRLRAEVEDLRRQLAEKNTPATVKSVRPVPEEELSPEQREIRALKDQLARRDGLNDAIEEHYEDAEGGIVVHFVADGLTSNNRVFYRGQEITFGREAYEQTVDRWGRSWLDMTENEQIDRFGEVKFRKGPWPGKREYEEETLKNVSISDQAPVLNL